LQLELKAFKNQGISVHMECTIDELCEKIIEKANMLSLGECGLRDFNKIVSEIFSEIHYAEFDSVSFEQVSFGSDIVDDSSLFTLKRK